MQETNINLYTPTQFCSSSHNKRFSLLTNYFQRQPHQKQQTLPSAAVNTSKFEACSNPSHNCSWCLLFFPPTLTAKHCWNELFLCFLAANAPLTFTRTGLGARAAVFSLRVRGRLCARLCGVSIIRWFRRDGSGVPLLVHGSRPGSYGRR